MFLTGKISEEPIFMKGVALPQRAQQSIAKKATAKVLEKKFFLFSNVEIPPCELNKREYTSTKRQKSQVFEQCFKNNSIDSSLSSLNDNSNPVFKLVSKIAESLAPRVI